MFCGCVAFYDSPRELAEETSSQAGKAILCSSLKQREKSAWMCTAAAAEPSAEQRQALLGLSVSEANIRQKRPLRAEPQDRLIKH